MPTSRAGNSRQSVRGRLRRGIIRHAALCAVGQDNGDYVFTPFGHLADGNPYDAYIPPDPDDPKGFVRPDVRGDAP